MNKKKMTKEERKEYLDERKTYINGMRESSQEFQKYMLLIAMGGFVYSISFYKIATCPLKISRILFGVMVIINILSYYCSILANEAGLERHETEKEEEKEVLEKTMKERNMGIDCCYKTSLTLLILSIVFFAIFFLQG